MAKAAEDSESKSDSKSTTEEEEGGKSGWNVVLIGDSVLDDFTWLKDPKMDVAAQLQAIFDAKKADVKVYNYAVDESTSDTTLNGKKPGTMYVAGRSKCGLEPYPVESDGAFKGRVMPLKLIARLTAADDKRQTLVVVSVGGNDFREMLLCADDSSELMEEAPGMLGKLEKNVRELGKQLKELKCRVVFTVCYEPRSDWLADMLPRSLLITLMDWGVQKLLNVAEEFGDPIIDLARTLDPFDYAHYGTTEIEPSNISGQFIADLVAYVLAEFEANGGKSPGAYMYYTENAGKKEGAAVVKQKIDEKSKLAFVNDLFERAGVSKDELDMTALIMGDGFAAERERLLSMSFFDM